MSKKLNTSIAIGSFLVAFMAIPLAQLAHFSMMPGDLGDARLNNYFLENIYQTLQGGQKSFVHLSFFYPYPYILGFSDNLFGAAPAYLIPRFITGSSDTAFQIWYLIGYVANYAATYYALRKLRQGGIAAVVGAIIFTFALPVTAQSGHAQLVYRFGVPLSATALIFFLEQKSWRYLAISGAWLVWQFYCTIYVGFFLLMLLVSIASIYILTPSIRRAESLRSAATDFCVSWTRSTSAAKIGFSVALIALLILMSLLFYPYLKVSELYGAKREWSEIATMLPRIQSYFLADWSWLWTSQSRIFADIPMRHEHQLFIGLVPMMLAVCGAMFGSREKDGVAFPLLGGALALLILITAYFGGYSLWILFCKLPLASAIRVVTRIILVLLFPIAYLAASFVDTLIANKSWGRRLVLVVLVPALLAECSFVSIVVSPKELWRERLSAVEREVPANLPKDAVLFFAQSHGPYFYADELDAMWVAINRGHPTLNGYSGIYPSGYNGFYGDDCAEMPKRILTYLNFVGKSNDIGAYTKLIDRVVPIGFGNCNPAWRRSIPQLTRASKSYTPEAFRALSLQYTGRSDALGQHYVNIKIENSSNQHFSAISEVNTPIRASWRVLDANGVPVSGWDTRKDLPFDIPAHSDLDLSLPVGDAVVRQGRMLEVSLVQENVFWAQDIGIKPLRINLGQK
ncbi:hypothetical protein [Paraburkholderia sp. CNPSo 3281]|uniref:hypothetical protein n=1 Tax=Paraburkholderia sp. CNPSo 3281 TaxID=2940933 RepID=UPI0020B8BDF3|nr:hypothetical protein [Paraburkholderia sp. CNPSo 3281]MCP3720355.1 hypothetical protein [Paraburkholderia sp. CNPSo 3281]